jgi:copper chaperone CopZ
MCVQHVTQALQDVAGVQSADVDLASGAVTVRHDETTDVARLIEAVAEAGYQAHRVWNEGN